MSQLITLLMVGFVAIGAITYAIKRRSLAQSVCVRAMTRLQAEMGSRLEDLQKLNRPAQMLRAEKEQADQEFQAAEASHDPIALTLAEAHQLSVYLRQSALRARQLAILAEAEAQRLRFEQEAKNPLRRFQAAGVVSRRGFTRALAVEPRPEDSLSPDYVPVYNFSLSQSHLLSFDSAIMPADLPLPRNILAQQFHTQCVVSLRSEGVRWRPAILTASVPLRLPSWR